MASIVRTGFAEIKAGYEMFCQKSPYYALFDASSAGGKGDRAGALLFSYDGDDTGEGWRLLEDNLKVVEQSSPAGMFIIRFYNEVPGKGITANTDYNSSFKLRLQQPEAYTPDMAVQKGGGNYLQEMIKAQMMLMQERNDRALDDVKRMYQDQIDELQAELEMKDEDPENEMQGIGAVRQWGHVVGELGTEFPWMQDILRKLTDAAHNLLNFQQGYQAPPRRSAQMGKVDYNNDTMSDTTTAADPKTELDTQLARLMHFYARHYGSLETHEGREKGIARMAADLKKLADMGEQHPMKLKGLLMML